MTTGNRPPTPDSVMDSNEAVNRTDLSINQHPPAPGDEPRYHSGAGTGNTAINDDPGANPDLPDGDGAVEPVAGNDASPALGNPGSTGNENTDAATPVLSQHVLNVITEVQTRQLDGQWEEALTVTSTREDMVAQTQRVQQLLSEAREVRQEKVTR